MLAELWATRELSVDLGIEEPIEDPPSRRRPVEVPIVCTGQVCYVPRMNDGRAMMRSALPLLVCAVVSVHCGGSDSTG